MTTAYKSAESGLPDVLKKLGSMTAIRDTYLVEQSLLRTLGPILGVFETSLYRLDEGGALLRSLMHSRTVATEECGGHKIAERTEETTYDHGQPDSISSEILSLLENVRVFGKPCSKKSSGELLICYPLRGGSELRGYFVFRRDREVTPVEDAIVNGVLEVFSNYYSLLDTSQRDQLTGLLNRYSLENNLDRIWNLLSARMSETAGEPARRHNTPSSYWLGIMDIDHFKSINDSRGHIIGDEVLIMASQLLQKSFRQSDLLYRYGGEEFVAIIAADHLDAATSVFERARKSVEKFNFPQVGRVTISGGFSSADPGLLPQEVIHRADSALYAAKNAGRNRIYHYDTLVMEGVLKKIAPGSIDLF